MHQHPRSADAAKEPRQAVVLVHGVGEQPPMRTLRSFTFGIGLARLFSSPDRIGDDDELRRLTQPPQPQHRAYTDFFELYWADLSPRADVVTSLWWGLRLLSRRAWWSMRGPAARLVLLLQVLAVVAVALIGWGVGAALASGGWSGLLTLVQRWQVWSGVGVGVIHLLLGHFLRSVLSDAVRYLTPRPANIRSRQAIRADGLALLRRLHESGRYSRIVIVGHSLGSVIAYDLVRGLWDELRHPDPVIAVEQPAASRFDDAADRIDPQGRPDADDVYLPPSSGPAPVVRDDVRPPRAADVTAFREAQFDLWQENRGLGVPWLITDLVTLGSPLTYAPLLLDEPAVAFGGRPGLTLADRQALKEYPRCPPIRDELADSRFYTRRYLHDGDVVPRQVGHTAGPFGPTRWSNLYFPVRSWLRGDMIGGPVAPHFGPGVRDVPVRLPAQTGWARLRRHFPLSHISYWWAPPSVSDPAAASTVPQASTAPQAPTAPEGWASPNIDAILQALRLDDIRWAPGPQGAATVTAAERPERGWRADGSRRGGP